MKPKVKIGLVDILQANKVEIMARIIRVLNG